MRVKLLKEKVGVGFGGFASFIINGFLMTWLTYFLTDSMMLSVATATAILLVARVLDAFTDFMMGIIIDKTKSKYGKARPWLLWMAVPTLISVVLLFYVPNFSEAGRAGY